MCEQQLLQFAFATSMATDCEKRLLKQFLDGIDTNGLCKIVRSVYHGGAIAVNSREGKAITFKMVCNIVISYDNINNKNCIMNA